MISFCLLLGLLLSLAIFSNASCHVQTPAFLPPDYTNAKVELKEALNAIEESLSKLFNDGKYNTSSYSVEVTSSQETFWSSFHTAEFKDDIRPGAKVVDTTSTYRIASITKCFTVLGILQQHAAGRLRLDDSVDTYIPELKAPQKGTLSWKDITIRSLASQLSGLPRDFAQGDLIDILDDPGKLGLPPANRSGLPRCDAYNEYKPCTGEDLIENLQNRVPLFAPNQKSTYSNLNYELLGLVLENVTGLPFEEYIETAVLAPLGMNATSFTKPPDSVAVLPKNESWYWDVDEGVQNPTGGLYATSGDMSKFLRYSLTHFNGITNALNWFNPVSFTAGPYSFYGLPWEIFRTDKILTGTRRTVTFFTKGGGLPAYSTYIIAVPEYNLGVTMLTGGHPGLLAEIRELVTVPLMKAVDALAVSQLKTKYSGAYASSSLNSSISFSYSKDRGLEPSRFVSNGTDVLTAVPELLGIVPEDLRLQVVPTMLYRDESRKRGELWRLTIQGPDLGNNAIWDDFCVTDIDVLQYAGRPLTEIVFWDLDDDGRFGKLELPAYDIELYRLPKESDEVAGIVVQGQ